MLKLVIKNEFMHGPIWLYEDGYIIDETKFIEKNKECMKLNEQIENLYMTYFIIDDKNSSPLEFDKKAEIKNRTNMKKLISKLKDILNDINDGSFIIVDEETPYLDSL